jgi:hypothetical protein
VDRQAPADQSAEQDLQVGDGPCTGRPVGIGLDLWAAMWWIRGDTGRGEPDRRGGVHLQERGAGAGWQVEGIGDAEDGGGLGGAEGPEADPEAEVAVEAAQAALVEALGGQQQVHAEAAPHPADGAEQVEELGTGGQELAELVDDDQQVRQRFQPWVGGAPGGVGP